MPSPSPQISLLQHTPSLHPRSISLSFFLPLFTHPLTRSLTPSHSSHQLHTNTIFPVPEELSSTRWQKAFKRLVSTDFCALVLHHIDCLVFCGRSWTLISWILGQQGSHWHKCRYFRLCLEADASAKKHRNATFKECFIHFNRSALYLMQNRCLAWKLVMVNI